MVSFRKILYSVVPQQRASEEGLLENEEKDIVFNGLPETEEESRSQRRPPSYRNRLCTALKYAHAALTVLLIFIVVQGDIKAQELSRWNANLIYCT